MRKKIKRFGKKEDKDNLFINVTTWDGKYPVLVVTPKKPTKKERKDTIDFILHELDDHDGYDEYCAEFDTAGYLRTLVDDAPGDMSFDDHVAAYQKYPDSTLHVVDEILERLREIFDDDFIFDHIRVDADMPGVQLRNSVICEFIQMKVATFALGHHVYLGDGVFCDQMTE